MLYIKKFAFINTAALTLLLLGCSNKISNKSSIKNIQSSKEEITLLFNGTKIPWKINNSTIPVPYNEDGNSLSFLTDLDSLTIKIVPKDTITVNFNVKNKGNFIAKFIGQQKPVSFNTAYKKYNLGKYQVLMPKLHELVHIVVSISNVGLKDSNLINNKTAYYNDVMKHFYKFKNHPLIDSLNINITKPFDNNSYNYYSNLKMNACMYSFKGKEIINESPYNALGFGGENYLKPLIPLFEDFAEKTAFLKFYEKHNSYYNDIINSYISIVPVKKMWGWLEAKFPQRYNSYKIYFSPLTGGVHSTINLSDNSFQETLMFINCPSENISLNDEAKLSRVIFTEIDHNYVNPTSTEYGIASLDLSPLSCWNSGQAYQSNFDTFNEYLTWSLFSMYLYDAFPLEVFKQSNDIEASFMVDGRGFIKFKQFNDFMLNWYQNSPTKTTKELYRMAITWFEENKCQNL